MDIKKSSISYSQENNMYKIDLGFNTRFFDSVIYSNDGNIYSYGKQILGEKSILLEGNYIFGFTELSLGKIIYILDVDKNSEKYRIVQDAHMSYITIQSKNYYVIRFLDFEGNISYDTNYQGINYKINCDMNKVFIQNTIFQTNIFEEYFCLQKRKINTKIHNSEVVSIAELFLFENIGDKQGDINSSVIQDILYLNNYNTKKNGSQLNIKIQEIGNMLNINIFSNGNLECIYDINKLFLGCNTRNILVYAHDNKEIKNIFSDYEDVSQLKLQELNFDFQIPDNILNYDEKYIDFYKNMLKLQYILYLMKSNYQKIYQHNDNIIHNNNFVDVEFLKLNIQKENLEKNILHYEKKYGEFLDIIHKLKK